MEWILITYWLTNSSSPRVHPDMPLSGMAAFLLCKILFVLLLVWWVRRQVLQSPKKKSIRKA